MTPPESGRRILYVQYTNPACYPPLERSAWIMATHGWSVHFLGTGSYGGNELRLRSDPRITEDRMPYCPEGWRQKFHYLRFCWRVLKTTLLWKPDWIYASDPLVTPVVALLSYCWPCQIIYHEHDSPNPPGRQGRGRAGAGRRALRARRLVALRARLCVLPNAERAAQFSKEIGRRSGVLTVWNCPSLDEVAPPKSSRHDETFRILYHGSIVSPRLPLTVVRALSQLPETVRLGIAGYETVGQTGYVQELQAIAAQLGIRDRIDWLGALPERQQLLEQRRQCDVGLAFMPKQSDDLNEQHMTGASNKPFDYLACGMGLLVSDRPDWVSLYVQPGYGLACDPEDPQSIADALRWLLEHPAERRAMGERGRQRILSAWNYEQQFAPVLARIESGDAGPKNPRRAPKWLQESMDRGG